MTQTILVFSQDTSDSLSTTTVEENLMWLTTLKNADKNQQLTLIQNRFFGQPIRNENVEMPVLIVDGVPISSNEKTRDFFRNRLTAEKVDIKVLDKEPEGLYIEKRFTGLIVITITDKRTSKEFKNSR